MNVSFELDARSFVAKLPSGPKTHGVIVRGLRRAGLELQREAMRRVPRRTGNTQRSITSTVDDADLSAVVRVGSRVGAYLEMGTGIYGPKQRRIYPRHARVLRFPVGAVSLSGRPLAGKNAQYVFTRSIRGMRKQPFLKPAVDVISPRLGEIFDLETRHLFGAA
jgi:hypothetical protein